jgi:hypothetical protein
VVTEHRGHRLTNQDMDPGTRHTTVGSTTAPGNAFEQMVSTAEQLAPAAAASQSPGAFAAVQAVILRLKFIASNPLTAQHIPMSGRARQSPGNLVDRSRGLHLNQICRDTQAGTAA